MEKDHVRTVKEAVYKVQLSLLDGIHYEKQLFTAGKLLSRADYEDVVTERAISNICGYPLCQNPLPLDHSQKGRYRIALKEHKVYDLNETRKFCSTECVINSRAFSANLKSEQHSVYDFTNVEEVLRLFGNFRLSNKENIVGKKEESGLPEITIVEKKDAKVGEISLEEWIGPANAIEGYVPLRERCISSSREKGAKPETAPKMENETLGDYLNFTSEIIMGNQQTIPKKPLIHKKNIETGGSAVTVGHQNSISRKSSSSKKKNSESKVKKQAKDVREKAELTTASLDVSSAVEAKTLDGSIEKVVEANERQHDSSTDAVAEERTNMWQLEFSTKLSGTKTSMEATETLTHSDNDQLVLTSNYLASNKLKDPSASEANGNHLKSSLKSSSGVKLNRNVTWADEKKPGDTSDGKLCKLQEIESHCERKESLDASVGKGESVSFRLASAEACAQALTQAAEAVASGELDSGDAVSGAGIRISRHDSEGHEDVSEPLQGGVKWPTKPVLLDTDAFDCDDSWHDSPPEGFRLTICTIYSFKNDLSPFSTMWMALFGWISSSSLAYIYGRHGSAEDAFSCVNGREYPHKTVLSDGRSLEIKQTLAICIAQALPELTTVLRISTPISTLEKAMVALLDTMYFFDALPPFKRKQWHVIVLLFLEALSVNRIPSLAQQMANMRVVKHKVLNGAQVSSEEYEIMKDLVIPLGRAPEFSVQSGG